MADFLHDMLPLGAVAGQKFISSHKMTVNFSIKNSDNFTTVALVFRGHFVASHTFARSQNAGTLTVKYWNGSCFQ